MVVKIGWMRVGPPKLLACMKQNRKVRPRPHVCVVTDTAIVQAYTMNTITKNALQSGLFWKRYCSVAVCILSGRLKTELFENDEAASSFFSFSFLLISFWHFEMANYVIKIKSFAGSQRACAAHAQSDFLAFSKQYRIFVWMGRSDSTDNSTCGRELFWKGKIIKTKTHTCGPGLKQ